MFDVVSLGTATYDVFLRSAGMQVEDTGGEKDICMRYGAKLEVSEIFFDYGGGGTNSAVTFARQGLKCATVVQVGDDFFGAKIIADLKKERIFTDLIDVRPNTSTDYSTILWAPDGGRTILIYRGKTKLEVENIDFTKFDTRWFFVSSLEGNLEILEKILEKQDVKVFFNPGGRELKQKERLIPLLSKITVLSVNKEEMEELLGSVGVVGDIKELLGKAQRFPCEYIVITDDIRGSFIWDKASLSWYKCGIFEDSPRVETTGAGDAYGSGLTTGLTKGYPLEKCLYLAAANASSVVAKVGAKPGILTENDLASWDSNKLKIEKITL